MIHLFYMNSLKIPMGHLEWAELVRWFSPLGVTTQSQNSE
jgi:hypothetical protein